MRKHVLLLVSCLLILSTSELPQLSSHAVSAQEPTPGRILIGPSPTPTSTPGGLVIGPSPNPAGTPSGLIIGPSPTPAASPLPGVSGTTYTSPAYGFSLAWDDSWTVIESASDGQEDRLWLTNGTSDVVFRAYPGINGDPVACLNGMVEALKNEAGVDDVGTAYGPDGKPLEGGNADQRYTVVTYQLQENGVTTPMAAYLDCRRLGAGDAVLEITHRTPLAAFNSESSNVLALLASLAIPSPGPATSTPTVTPESAADCAGVDAWLADTRPRLDRRTAIAQEAANLQSSNITAALGTLAQWAEELSLMAQDQRALTAPPAVAELNAELAALFQTESDLINQAIQAAFTGDAAALQQAALQLQQTELEFNRLKARVNQLASKCGLPMVG